MSTLNQGLTLDSMVEGGITPKILGDRYEFLQVNILPQPKFFNKPKN